MRGELGSILGPQSSEFFSLFFFYFGGGGGSDEVSPFFLLSLVLKADPQELENGSMFAIY